MLEVVLQVVVSAWGAPKDVDWFVPEPAGYVHNALLRVLCNVRNDFASNLGVKLWVTKRSSCNSS